MKNLQYDFSRSFNLYYFYIQLDPFFQFNYLVEHTSDYLAYGHLLNILKLVIYFVSAFHLFSHCYKEASENHPQSIL